MLLRATTKDYIIISKRNKYALNITQTFTRVMPRHDSTGTDNQTQQPDYGLKRHQLT